ncbi:hypothetical protein FNA46_19110 [Rhizobium straminoryzae]|uniref:Amine oxidase domain-containing protein n=2 Tax=Rhizobium straminoryzae TaxID=1387186 RepID=A0A549T268_9HYPH|nr:hypothetical protein FNA46_19110 [Rhizobium straminoryzae]
MGAGLGNGEVLLGALPPKPGERAMTKPSVAIIGAGMAGLTLARRLSATARVTVFDKSRGTGGRLATRRTETTAFDHGAQYFTIRDSRFHTALEPYLEAGQVQAWAAALMRIGADGASERLADRAPRFVGVPAMTALPKALAEGLDLRLGCQILALQKTGDGWHLATKDRTFGPFDRVVATAPAPQTRQLMPFAAADLEALDGVRMNGCFTLMLTLKEGTLPPAEAAQVEHPVISWIAANHGKPDRDTAPALVVHANNRWADQHLEAPLETVRDSMMAACRTLCADFDWDAVLAIDIHRWRYANVETPLGQPFLLDNGLGLAACGDWCVGNRVEAAFLSATALADVMEPQLAKGC